MNGSVTSPWAEMARCKGWLSLRVPVHLVGLHKTFSLLDPRIVLGAVALELDLVFQAAAAFAKSKHLLHLKPFNLEVNLNKWRGGGDSTSRAC